MILGTDGGIRTFGWAVVAPRTARVVACGALIQESDPKRHGGVHADRVYRASAQARTINAAIRKYGVTHLAAEEMSFPPRSSAAAKIGIGLSWGNLIGIARARLGKAVIVVPPKKWQRAIVPLEPGEKPNAAIDYAKVHKVIAEYVDLEATGLDAVAPCNRNHPFDAIGIATYVALVALGATSFHDERTQGAA